jgi:tetraacyldisaccharide 4'-kinase
MKSLLLPPMSALYDVVTRTRLSLYRRGTFQTTKLDRPVISVGNLTVGGTGKTPLVEWVARVAARTGKKVCILTRGYGRENPQREVIVSDGRTILATPSEAGDEPYLLATNLMGIAAVISDADRARAGQQAIDAFGTDCFILDDGFQHLRLARDLDIVTVDATNPWGGGHLLPYGRLRESRSGLSRADSVVLTRCDQVEDVQSLRREIEALIRGPVFESTMKPSRDPQPGGAVAAFCGVGNPQSFFALLKKSRYDVVLEKTFPDHHVYTQGEIDELVAAATQAGASNLITTAKDAVKLKPLSLKLKCDVLEIEISIEHEDELTQLILNAVGAA